MDEEKRTLERLRVVEAGVLTDRNYCSTRYVAMKFKAKY